MRTQQSSGPAGASAVVIARAWDRRGHGRMARPVGRSAGAGRSRGGNRGGLALRAVSAPTQRASSGVGAATLVGAYGAAPSSLPDTWAPPAAPFGRSARKHHWRCLPAIFSTLVADRLVCWRCAIVKGRGGSRCIGSREQAASQSNKCRWELFRSIGLFQWPEVWSARKLTSRSLSSTGLRDPALSPSRLAS